MSAGEPVAVASEVARSESEEQTLEIGRRLAAGLRPAGVLLVLGDLGAGKTVLARGVAEGLGIDGSLIQSPTFTLVHEHSGAGGDLLHLDLYRLEPQEVWELGIEDLLAREAVKVIEWPDRLPLELSSALRVEIVVRGDGSREVRITAPSGDDP